MTEQEEENIHQYLIRVLPKLLRETPEIVYTIEGILAESFPRRDEFARLLDEFTSFREETRGNFEGVYQRFDGVDQRFDGVDQHFVEITKEFGEVHEELGGLKQAVLKNSRAIAKVEHGQESIIRRMDGMEAWYKYLFGNLGNELGHKMEDMVAAALRYGLKNPDIKAETLRLRQIIPDPETLIYEGKPFTIEVDLIVENDRIVVFEVKAGPKIGDINYFRMKVNLIQRQNPDQRVEGVFIAPGASDEFQRYCDELGLSLVR